MKSRKEFLKSCFDFIVKSSEKNETSIYKKSGCRPKCKIRKTNPINKQEQRILNAIF